MKLIEQINKERQALDRSIYLLSQGKRNHAPEAMLNANRLAIRDHQNKLMQLVAQL